MAGVNASEQRRKNRSLRINEIHGVLKELLEGMENDESSKIKANNFKLRINKILRQLSKLQGEKPELESDSEPDSGSEPDEDEVLERDVDLYMGERLSLDMDKVELEKRVKKKKELDEAEFDAEEHMLSIQQLLIHQSNEDDPFTMKRPRPKNKKKIPSFSGGSSLVYEPSLIGNDPKTLQSLRGSAQLAINSYNNKHHTEYSVVDMVGAIQSQCAGYVLHLGFTAIKPGDAVAKHFQTVIYYGIGKIDVQSVRIVD
ncbi:hypothetical protein ABFS82_06G127100 [Erythranthe guttata]|uniref:uncharacterized protein LOC105960414 n=1 Tax=Erythranthe guttata TaxID=4155 RepID=UPI00064DDDA5|nr:PREDICTED: uncharacterized protein LOC105960414 [Erythranthe guttata]|eukprot:XP_012840037.1 PREDICTED: uncharacterized protein LOC105960414 [Erythranthe guttata]